MDRAGVAPPDPDMLVAVVGTIPPDAAALPLRRYHAAGGVVIAGTREQPAAAFALLMQRTGRRANPDRPGEVRLPKGHVEPGETLDECAVREVREETGLRHPRVVAPLGSVQNCFVHKRWRYERRETWFLMAAESPDPDAVAMDSPEPNWRPFWCPLTEAEGRLTYESERLAMRLARQAFTAAAPGEPAGSSGYSRSAATATANSAS